MAAGEGRSDRRIGTAATAGAAAILIAAAASFPPGPSARAAGVAAFDGELAFQIPAEPLDQALSAYARASGVDILYVQGLAAGRLSTTLNGRYTEAAALRTLLQGTGLVGRFTSRKAAIVFLPGAATPASGGPPLPSVRLDMAQVRAPVMIGRPAPAPFDAYARGAESEIRAVLSRDPACRGASFRIIVAVQIAESGRIGDVNLMQGSGDVGRDSHIRRALIGLALSKPPAGLTRPLQFEIDWSPAIGRG